VEKKKKIERKRAALQAEKEPKWKYTSYLEFEGGGKKMDSKKKEKKQNNER